MPRNLSSIAPDWWDYTTLDDDIIQAAARLTPEKMLKLSRPGFKIAFYGTFEEFYLAEALEYINAWSQSTDDNPVGICGPIGPTEQLPLVAQIVNGLNLNIRSAHFWGMDEWHLDGREVPVDATGIGASAERAMPAFEQIFVAKDGFEGIDLERQVYIARKRIEHEVGVYVASLSTRTRPRPSATSRTWL